MPGDETAPAGYWFKVEHDLVRGLGALGITQEQWAVLCVLMSYADEQDQAWPSVATIARCLGMCIRQVQMALGGLLSGGFLAATERRGRSTLYDLEPLRKTAPVRKTAGVRKTAPVRKTAEDPCGKPQGTPAENRTRVRRDRSVSGPVQVRASQKTEAERFADALLATGRCQVAMDALLSLLQGLLESYGGENVGVGVCDLSAGKSTITANAIRGFVVRAHEKRPQPRADGNGKYQAEEPEEDQSAAMDAYHEQLRRDAEHYCGAKETPGG